MEQELNPNTIIKYYRYHTETAELDLLNRDQILGKNWLDDNQKDPEEINVAPKRWAGQTLPINIDELIDLLNKIKTRNCNYVEIMYHSDHQTYHLTGLEMRKATIPEIRKANNELKERASNIAKEKIGELEKQIEDYKKWL